MRLAFSGVEVQLYLLVWEGRVWKLTVVWYWGVYQRQRGDCVALYNTSNSLWSRTCLCKDVRLGG